MSHRPRSHRRDAEETDASLVARLTTFIEAEKTPSGPVDWVPDHSNFRFAIALDIKGITVAGMLLHGRASLFPPERDITLGLSWNDPSGQGGNFERLDWRPIHAHNNKGLGPSEHRFILIESTHRHCLAANAALAMGMRRAMAERLPVALPVEPDPPDWSSLLARAAHFWNLQGIVHISRKRGKSVGDGLFFLASIRRDGFYASHAAARPPFRAEPCRA